MEITKLSLKAWRIFRNMEQQKVAEKLKITPAALSLYESGKRIPRQNVIDKLLKLYGCKYEQVDFK